MMRQTVTDAGDGETNSIASAVSGIKTQFSWLFPPGAEVDAMYYLTEERYQEKQNTLLDCLRGDNDTIDLWELRELALSPGGLLDPSIRKRAWPILTAAHNVALIGGEVPSLSSSSSSADAVAPSHVDLQMLQRDVKRTVWNVEEHFMQQLKAKEIAKSKRRVSFAPVCDVQGGPGRPVKSFDDEKKDDEGPPSAVTSPTSEDANDHDDDEDEDHPCASPWSHTSDVSAASSSVWSHSMTSSCRRLSFRKASRTEQKIVSNVVTSVLRTAAPDNEAFEDDRFHYYTGLHDLTALLMVNLESPSLSSIVLGRLAVYHLRDAMRRERAVMESALQLLLFPMLQQVDPELHAHITTKAGLTLPTFARGWVSSWFATDVVDIAAASRLLDVFLVSHAAMPIYCAVALLTVNRKRILDCNPELREVYHTMRNLSLMVVEDDDEITVASNRPAAARTNALVHVEQVIALATRYMKRFPPENLVALAAKKDQQELLLMVPAIAMLQKSQIPSWCTADTSPNEWGILQRAKALRSGTDAPETGAAIPVNASKYPLAMVASGKVTQRNIRPKVNTRSLSKLLVVIVAAFIIINLSGNSDVQWLGDRLPARQKQANNIESTQFHDIAAKAKKAAPSPKNVLASMQKTMTSSHPTEHKADEDVELSRVKMRFKGAMLAQIQQRASKFATSITTVIKSTSSKLYRSLEKVLQNVDLARTGKAFVNTFRERTQKAVSRIALSTQGLKESATNVGRSIQHPLSGQQVELTDIEKSFNDAILAPTHKIVSGIGRNIQKLDFAKAAAEIAATGDIVGRGMELGAVAVEKVFMDLVAAAKVTVEKVGEHINMLVEEVQRNDPFMVQCRGKLKFDNSSGFECF